MLRCNDVTEKAHDLLEGRLSRADRWRMRLHLFICVHCRRFVRQLKVTIGAVAGMPSAQPPGHVVEAQAERLKRAMEEHTPPRDRPVTESGG